MSTEPEGGLTAIRAEFVRESTVGTTPTDPSLRSFSERVTDITISPGPNSEERRGINVTDPWDVDTFSPAGQNVEDHSLDLTYDLYDWLIDGSSNPQNAAGDAWQRDATGDFKNTHSIILRQNRDSSSIGVDSAGKRTYIVAKGCFPDSCTLRGEPETGDPVMVDLSYVCEKIRIYEIDQPASSGTVTVTSSDSNDTSQSVTIEDEGANTTETVTLSGTSDVSTTATFGDVDAVYLDSDTVGDITVTHDANSVDIMVIQGDNEYDGVEGDKGVPGVGSGSRTTDLASNPEEIIGDTIERPSGTTLEDVINAVEFSVENNVDTAGRHDTMRPEIQRGDRNVTVTATVFGDNATFSKIEEALRGTENNIVWTLDSGSIQADSARLTDAGDISWTTGQTRVQLDNTFTGKGVTLT